MKIIISIILLVQTIVFGVAQLSKGKQGKIDSYVRIDSLSQVRAMYRDVHVYKQTGHNVVVCIDGYLLSGTKANAIYVLIGNERDGYVYHHWSRIYYFDHFSFNYDVTKGVLTVQADNVTGQQARVLAVVVK